MITKVVVKLTELRYNIPRDTKWAILEALVAANLLPSTEKQLTQNEKKTTSKIYNKTTLIHNWIYYTQPL